MGMSALIGLKSAVLFAVFLAVKNSGHTLLALPILYAALVDLLVAGASHPALNLPILLAKSSDGSFPLWSLLVFSPFLFFARFFVFLRRRLLLRPEPAFDEVAPGLFVGGWPSHLDRLPPGDPAVVDCTCELPRRLGLGGGGYLCLPTWDTRAPSPAEIELAVRWAAGKRSQKKPVYVHCAFGHGRSVTVMCAFLVAFGIAEDWKHAEIIIKEKRPCIHMNALHRRTLEEWSLNRLSPIKKGRDVSSIIMSSSSRN